MTSSPHQLLLASAGTGKTWRLSGRFLELLFSGVEPERVLATTFTRKAAGEILERVLERLVDAAEDEAKLGELREATRMPALEAQACVALLAKVTRRLDRLQVRTLDAFFAHLARLFALDIDLASGWTMADDREDAELVAQAVGRVLAEAPIDERVALMRALKREAAARAVLPSLQTVVRNFRPAFQESAPEAWGCVPKGAALGEEGLARTRAELETLSVPKKKDGAPLVNWQKARDNLLRCVTNGQWEELLALGLVKKVQEGETKFATRDIDEDWVRVIEALSGHAAAELLDQLARQNGATREFLAGFDEAYRDAQRERGAYRFDDLPQALAPGFGESSGPIDARQLDLWFRLDAKIDHLLLDEFQDTAPLQWRVLAPLADEILADGSGERSFFCVGDVKQSIYGWRAAEPRLLKSLAERYPVLEPETMETSYRSSPVVLGAVNELFEVVAESAVFAGDASAHLCAAAQSWAADFHPHESARAQLGGWVELREAPEPVGDETAETATMGAAARRVAEIVATAPRGSVGVLMRRKKHIPRLIYLMRKLGIRASGEGGNPLTDSLAVNALLSLLHLADHPGDTAAAFHVATSPMGAVFELDPEGLRDDGNPRLPSTAVTGLARRVRERLVSEGYGAFCSQTLADLQERGGYEAWELSRLAQLAELALSFDDRAGLRPSEFVELARDEKVEDPSSAHVRVMTIHASKGLEFDAVVLPELDVNWFSRPETVLSRRADPFGAVDAVTSAPKKALRAHAPALQALFEHVQGRGLEEALSLLYVAMTRAKRRLEMVVNWRDPAKAKLGLDWASILRARFVDAQEADEETDEDGVLWQSSQSSAAWADGLQDGAAPAESRAARAPLGLKAGAASRVLESRTPSAEEGGGGVAELLRSPRPEAVQRGTLVHALLEQLEWLEEFELDAAGAAALEPDPAVRAEAAEWLRAALAAPEVRAELSRAEQGDQLSVERERRFEVLLRDEDGEEGWWRGSIDRVVVERRAGQIAGVVVLDYKTDALDAGGLEERTAVYRPQIEAYRRAAAVIYGVEPDMVRGKLVFLGAGQVVSL